MSTSTPQFGPEWQQEGGRLFLYARLVNGFGNEIEAVRHPLPPESVLVLGESAAKAAAEVGARGDLHRRIASKCRHCASTSSNEGKLLASAMNFCASCGRNPRWKDKGKQFASELLTAAVVSTAYAYCPRCGHPGHEGRCSSLRRSEFPR